MKSKRTATWSQVRGLRIGTGLAVELPSGDRYAGKLVRIGRDSLTLQRADNRGVQNVMRANVKEMRLMDWQHEMLAYEDEGE